MNTCRTVSRCGCLALFLAAAGCSEADSWNRQYVSGEVTLDGVPLDAGSIEFRPAGTQSSLSGGAVIADGNYEIEQARGLPPGEYQVRIHSGGPAHRPSPDEPPGLIPMVQERIPARYNAATTLSAQVTAEGPNEFDFDLDSK